MAILAACASTSHPEPEILLTQLSNVADIARHITGGITVQYRLAIHNTTPDRLTLRRADFQSVGAGAYSLPAFSRPFQDSIDPGETKAVEVWGSAVIDDPTIAGANGPVTIRAVLLFDSPNGSFQSVIVQQVHASPTSE